MRQQALLDEAKAVFESTASAEAHNRTAAQKDLRFARLAEQWPHEIQKKRQANGQVCLTVNRLPSFIRQVVNDARQRKPQIKIHPVDDKGDLATARVINGLIRNIEYTSSADIAYDTGVESAVTAGYGYWTIGIDYADEDRFDLDLQIHRVANIFSIYGDPDSNAADSSDWNSAFVIDTLKASEFEADYGPKARKIDWASASGAALKPVRRRGDSPREARITVARWWRREPWTKHVLELTDGTILEAPSYIERAHEWAAMGITVHRERQVTAHRVTRTTLSGAEVLEEQPWPGKYIPIIPVYGDEVIIDDQRHLISFIRDAKDPQRMLNFWRTQSTQLVALAPNVPYIGKRNSFNSDRYKWETAHERPWAYLEYDGDTPPTREGFNGPPAGAIQEALNASDDIKSVLGLYDASLGARSNETSGRAIEARQREGDISTFHFSDNHVRAIQHTGRVLIDLIPKVYSGSRMVRVLGERGTDPEVVRLGPAASASAPGAAPPPGEVLGGEPGAQAAESAAVPRQIYDLTLGKYDLVVSAGKNYQTQRLEAADEMFKFLEFFPQAAPYIGHLLAMNLDWPGAEEIAEALKAMVPNAATENPQEMRQALTQLSEQVQQLEQRVNDKQAQDQGKLEVQRFEAQTKRLQSLLPMMTTDEVSGQINQFNA